MAWQLYIPGYHCERCLWRLDWCQCRYRPSWRPRERP